MLLYNNSIELIALDVSRRWCMHYMHRQRVMMMTTTMALIIMMIHWSLEFTEITETSPVLCIFCRVYFKRGVQPKCGVQDWKMWSPK